MILESSKRLKPLPFNTVSEVAIDRSIDQMNENTKHRSKGEGCGKRGFWQPVELFSHLMCVGETQRPGRKGL